MKKNSAAKRGAPTWANQMESGGGGRRSKPSATRFRRLHPAEQVNERAAAEGKKAKSEVNGNGKPNPGGFRHRGLQVAVALVFVVVVVVRTSHRSCWRLHLVRNPRKKEEACHQLLAMAAAGPSSPVGVGGFLIFGRNLFLPFPSDAFCRKKMCRLMAAAAASEVPGG